MKKFFFFYLCLFVFAFAKTNYNEEHDFLEIAKNYQRVHTIQKERSNVNRALEGLDNINFAMRPYIAPIKPFDEIKVFYAYPLKIFLPVGTTVTSAILSNSKMQPEFSQNVVKVKINDSFESGLLDIVYVKDTDIKTGNYISIKLDKYVFGNNSKSILRNKLYTQVKYYFPKRLTNEEVLAKLKPSDYGKVHNQIEYMGVVYDIYLVNIIKNLKVIKKYKDKKFINVGMLYKGKAYNYFITTKGISDE